MPKTVSGTVLAASLSTAALFSFPSYAEGPWVGETGEQSFTASVVYETYDEIYKADDKQNFNADSQQANVWLEYSVAVTDRLTLGLTTGATWSRLEYDEGSGAAAEDFSGRADSSLSAKYLVRDEFAEGSGVTLSVYGAVIGKGTYRRSFGNSINAPDDKADGVEAAVKVGKVLDQGWAVFGDLGYRVRGQSVPDDLFFNFGANKKLSDRVSAFCRLDYTAAQSGFDIGSDDWEADGTNPFHQVQEETTLLQLGTSVSINKRHSLGFILAALVDGRNTGNSRIFSGSYSLFF